MNKPKFHTIDVSKELPELFIGKEVKGYHDHGGLSIWEGEECNHEWVKDKND